MPICGVVLIRKTCELRICITGAARILKAELLVTPNILAGCKLFSLVALILDGLSFALDYG